MLALRILADLFLLLFLGGRASFSTANNNTHSTLINTYMSIIEEELRSTSSSFASQASNFTYSIPYGQLQECDIYGPLCQTGSITVTVNLTNVTTATVLPCSSYLTLQSYYLRAQGDLFLGDYPTDHWYTSFGRSPQCTSLAQAYSRGQFTLSNCGNNDTVMNADFVSHPTDPGQIPSLQQPPGMLRQFNMNYVGTCCGNCTPDISEGRLYYFPDNTSSDCSSDKTYNSTLLSAGNLEKRAQSIIANASIAVVSGNTFTSPSVYLQMLGTAGLRDMCDTVGPILTNAIVTFPPGGLSTWKPPTDTDDPYYRYGLGSVWANYFVGGAADGHPGSFAPLDVKDLACSTWGLGRSTDSSGSVITTIGPPFLPLLMPNTQMFSLDPTWARLCTGLNLDTYAINQTFIILDPPTALTPEAMMVPTSDSAPNLTPRPNPADPTTMADPPVTSSTSPARPVSGPVNPQISPTNVGDLSKGGATTKPSPVQPKLPEPVFPFESQRHPEYLSPSPNGDPNKPLEASKVQIASVLESTDPVFQQEDRRHSQTQGLGAIIYNALGRSGNEPSRDTGNVDTVTLPNAGVQEVPVGGTRILSVNSLGAQVDGVAYSAGGPALTISGKVFTFVPQPNNNDRDGDRPSDPPSEPSNDPRPVSSLLSIAGQLITLNPSRMLVAGSTILPGGPPITLSNTPLSLDSSGVLLYGSFSTLLSPQSVFTIQSQPITANAAGFAINGESISPGGSAQTIDGTIISLGQSGRLAIGSTLISLPTPETHPLAGPAGSKILSGGPPITLSNTPLSLDSSGVLHYNSFSTLLSPQSIFTIQSQPITANAAGFVINGGSISPGGSAQTIDGTIISLGQSGQLAIGSTFISLPTPETDPLAGPEVMIAGQTVTPNPSELTIAGTTIRAGGPAATVGGTVLSLQTSGALIVGSSTIQLSALQRSLSFPLGVNGLAAQGTSSSLAVIDGVTFTPGKAGVPVAGSVVGLGEGGKTLGIGSAGIAFSTGTPGKAGLPAAGSVVGLEEGGKTLGVGSVGIAISTGGANAAGAMTIFKGGQEREIKIPVSMIRAVGVWAVWLSMA